MRSAAVTLALLVVSLLGCQPTVAGTGPTAAPGDWPWWRGPTLDGKSGDQKAPTKWSGTDNVVWKVEVPGLGHSSPCVCGDRVFLTTADEKAQKQFVLAFDRKTGKQLWSTLVYEGGFMRKNGKNSHASATCACDGKRVYGVFLNHDALHVTATDLDGKIVWQREAGKFDSEHGYGGSPILHGSLVIVNGDSLKNCFQTALDAETGKEVWKTARKATGKHGNYATPVVVDVAGKRQLIQTGFHEVSSYDPDTGKLLWSCAGPSEVTACTAAAGDGLVFVTGGFPEKELLAIKADGSGDVTKSNVAWRTNKGVTYVPSPLYHEGHLYVVADGGVASCFEGKGGKQVWQEKVSGNFTASPVLVGDLIYVTNEAGRTYVIKTGPKFEVVATNDVDEPVLETLAVCGGQLFLRSDKHLYCIGKP